MKIGRFVVFFVFGLGIMLLGAPWMTAVHANAPESETETAPHEDEKLAPDEVKAWLDEHQIEYSVRSASVNSYMPSRAELTALFLQGENPYPDPMPLLPGEETFSESLSDLTLANGDRWQRHYCHPRNNRFLKLGGQTLTGIADESLYYFDHRREYFRALDPTPRTYTVTEGPDGELSDAQSLSGNRLGYALYTVSVVYDIEWCFGWVCTHEVETDVEVECEFEAN